MDCNEIEQGQFSSDFFLCPHPPNLFFGKGSSSREQQTKQIGWIVTKWNKVGFHPFFCRGFRTAKSYAKHTKTKEKGRTLQNRIDQEYQPTRKSRVHENINFLTKTHEFHTKPTKTSMVPKVHQTVAFARLSEGLTFGCETLSIPWIRRL